MPDLDAILIPGGGLRKGGELPDWVVARLERALERHRGEYLILLSAATAHRPLLLDEAGMPVYESVQAAAWFKDAGVPPERILFETASWDTIGNAFFARVAHTDPLGLRRLLVVNSAFHMARTQAIFDWVFSLEPANPPYFVQYETVPDRGMEASLVKARRTKEEAGLGALQPLRSRIRTMAEFHQWLFSEHDVYATARLGVDRVRLAPEVLETY